MKRVYVNKGGKLVEDHAATAAHLVAGTKGIHQKIVDDVPSLQSGKVTCRTCGNSQTVDPSQCLASGWPKCCGSTMSLE